MGVLLPPPPPVEGEAPVLLFPPVDGDEPVDGVTALLDAALSLMTVKSVKWLVWQIT